VNAKLRVGLVGANWGATHVDAWRRVPAVELSAICTAHEETARDAARQFSIPHAYSDAMTMVREADIDVVDITTRPSIRAPIALAALEAGKHVIHPLPFALGLDGARAQLELAERAGVTAWVENLHRHTPAFIHLKALVDDGFLGDLYSVNAIVQASNFLNRPPNYVYAWNADASSGASAVRNFGAHMLHCLLWLLGDIVEVSAVNARMLPELVFTDGSRLRNEVADVTYALLRFANGAPGTMHTSWSAPASDGFRIDAVGSKGRAVITADGLGPQNPVLLTASSRDTALREVPIAGASPGADRQEALASMCLQFAEAVAGGSVNSGPTYREAYRVMQIVEATYEADARKSWVEVP
jgi:predicted dehydrogenase